MAERKLKITNFRNVGIKEDQILLLNTSLEKGEMGNLVILVGPNNCGKSNCLDALYAFGTQKGLSVSDIPDFDNENPIPEVSLVICDNQVVLGMNKTLNNSFAETEHFFYKDDEKKVSTSNVKVPSKEALDLALRIINFNISNNQISKVPSNYQKEAMAVYNSKKVEDVSFELISSIQSTNISIWGKDYISKYINLSFSENQIKELIEEFKLKNNLIPNEIKSWEESKGIKVIPNILRFKETVKTQNQLQITPEQINSSPFFSLLFSIIEYDPTLLNNCYNKVKQQNHLGLLKKTQSEINKKLEEISNQFNKLFIQSENKYKFEIRLETNSLYLTIFIGEIPLHLDKQSSGFKWFFNFYFSVLAQTSMQRGDIIIMDEPATNLHMQGIQELRSFIKEYAKKTEMTFVISTHIPFFVDIDYLEEVRVVHRVGESAVIDNKFHAIGVEETDALKAIKDALTVGRYVLYDQNNKHTIFVEGITDYCYLTAFKILFKMNNIVFLPIQGVYKNGIIDTLQKSEKYPTILVDGDTAGLSFKEKNSNKKNVEIFALTDCDPNWKTIEDLFSNEDKQKTKFFNDCVAFKNRLTSSKVSKQTKENFKKLLDYISL